MGQAAEPTALADIAAAAGLSTADVAFTAGLDESTISRLWTDPNWLDRITGASLQRVVASVPGVDEYVKARSHHRRLAELAADLAGEGLDVDESAVRACLAEDVPGPYISNALQAAVHIVRGDDVNAAPALARFWGRDQDRALERLFSDGEGRLLVRPDRLLRTSVELAPRLRRPAYSFHRILAEAAIAHHAMRVEPDTLVLTPVASRREAMTLRSTTMGVLIKHDDYDLAQRYERLVEESPVLQAVEDWAFPTYTRDAQPDSAFALPRSLLLRNTAAEVIHELACYSGAYVHYLLSVYVPLALARDPTFGLAIDTLAAAIRQRLSHDGDPALHAVCESTLRDLGGTA
ncbi:MAG: hypothetical protein ACRDOH_07825 [Streptosporangiaceae bacterium]